ncbi:unnamed protein product, partial [Meganyctiphanes norvegica]
MKYQWRKYGYSHLKNNEITLRGMCQFVCRSSVLLFPWPLMRVMASDHENIFYIQGSITVRILSVKYCSLIQLIGANAANKYGGRRVLCFAVLLWSLCTVITPLAASYLPALITTRVLLGLGEGLGLPTIFQLFAQHIPPEERSRAFGYMVSAGSVGQTVALLFVPHLEWHIAFTLFGALGLVWVLCWLLTYHDPPMRIADEEDQQLLEGGEVICISWVEWVTHWAFWSIYIAHFAMNWSNYIIMQWLPTYLSRTLNANKESMSLTAVPYIVSSLCGTAWGHIADQLVSVGWSVLRVRRIMTLLGLLGPGICLALFPEVTNLPAAVLVISLAMGLCAANSSGHLSNHADIAPNHAGVTFAISNTIATIPGILCGPVTAELVTASHGRWFPVFFLAGTINATAAIIYYTQSYAKPVL